MDWIEFVSPCRYRAGMRVRASLILSAAIAGLAASGCGGDDRASDGRGLTKAEEQLVKRHHLEARKLLSRNSVDTEGAQRLAERQCAQWAKSGPTLRAVAATCEQALTATADLAKLDPFGERCDEEDLACSMRSVRRTAITFGRLDRAFQASGAVVSRLDASENCRAMIDGSEGVRKAAGEAAAASKSLLVTIRASSSDEVASSSEATKTNVDQAGKDAEALAEAVEALGAAQKADLRIDDESCAAAVS